jgi:hypothetical protein
MQVYWNGRGRISHGGLKRRRRTELRNYQIFQIDGIFGKDSRNDAKEGWRSLDGINRILRMRGSSEAAETRAFPSATWERGGKAGGVWMGLMRLGGLGNRS